MDEHSCLKMSREDIETIFKAAEQQKNDRARLMPDVETALTVLTQAFHRLKELGWREAMYCPKDGSYFEVIEAGSSGIHTCNYFGKWPNGWWISEAGDLWPSHPILWRPTSHSANPVQEQT